MVRFEAGALLEVHSRSSMEELQFGMHIWMCLV